MFFSPDHLIMYLESVAEVAPHLPMYYYHIPFRTGVRCTYVTDRRACRQTALHLVFYFPCSHAVSMEEFLDSASSRLPTLRGLKYTDTDLFEFGRCVTNQGEKYQIIYGTDAVNSVLADLHPYIKRSFMFGTKGTSCCCIFNFCSK